MNKVLVMTDSNSGITPEEREELGIEVIPMPFLINGETYHEGEKLTQDTFFDFLQKNAEVSTSQPSIDQIVSTWEQKLNDYEEIVYIPMSSALSGSCNTATVMSRDFEGKVEVVNNQRISVTQRQLFWTLCDWQSWGNQQKKLKQFWKNKNRNQRFISCWIHYII